MALTALWRGERSWAVVAGGAAGGVVVGALGSALASYGLRALTGMELGRVTGLFEGMVLGLAAAAATVVAWRLSLARPVAVVAALVCGAGIAAMTAAAGGRFYATTLAILEWRFPHSDLRMAGVGSALGEIGTATLEGAVFAACITFTNIIAKSRQI